MAILSGTEIKRQMALGNIVISPAQEKIGPNSVDLRLSDKLLVYNTWGGDARRKKRDGQVSCLDTRQASPTEALVIPEEGLELVPGILYLGSTHEWTETRGFVPYLDGRSSAGRAGIFIHCTAGRGDNGFQGHWTCEISVIHRVRIYPLLRCMQITYHTVAGEQEFYQGRYQGDREPVASRIHEPQK